MIDPNILDVIQKVFQDPNSEQSKKADIAYNQARGLGEGEDYIKAHDLFVRRLKTEAEYGEISKLRADINRKLKEAGGNLSLDDLTGIDMSVDALSKKLGRSFGIDSEVEGDRVNVNTEGLDRIVEQISREHSTVASKIDESVSPQMAQRLGFDYRMLGEQERQRTMKTAPTNDLIQGLVRGGNQEDLNRVLEESGQKAPRGFARSARRWSGGDEGDLYQEAAEKIVGEEQELFRTKLEEVALEKARERSNQIESEYKKRAEEQGELLSRWQDEGDEPYLEDLRLLREKGFLKPEEAASYATSREEIVNDPVQGQALAADVITARNADQGTETAFGYPVDPQQQEGGTGVMGLGAATGVAGKAGSLLGDSKAGQMVGKLAGSGALRALGPAALGYAGLSATADLTSMSGRTGAGSMTNAATSVLPGIGGLVGSLGGPIGAAAGLGLGYGVSKAVGGAMAPYADQVAFAKQTEAITGSNLQGEGAANNALQALQVATPFWGAEEGSAGSLLEAQNRSRLANPFMDPALIDTLSTELLKLGDSVESAAGKVEPLSRLMADFNVPPELVAQLERAGSTGSLGGVASAELTLQLLQAQSGRGFTQEDLSSYVGQAIETLGPVSGYDTAPGTALAYGGLMSRGGEESDMLFQNAQTVNSMIASDAAMMNDPMSMMMMGMDPSLSPEQQDPGAMAAGRIELAKQLGEMVEIAPDGNLSTNGRMQLQQAMSMEPWATAFQGMGVDEVAEMITNDQITPGNARKEFEAQKKARQKKEKDQSLAAKGIEGQKWKIDDLGSSGWETGVRVPGRQSDAFDLYEKSGEQAKGQGALGQLVAKNQDLDLENVYLKGGGTLADAQDDPKLLERLNKGREKLRVGGKNLTVADYNLMDIRGQAFMGERGGLNLGDPGKQEKGGSKVEIDLSERASKYFSVQDVRNPQGAAGSTTESQNAYAANTGKKNMNDRPIYGGG